jgi:hypothetical protein
MVALRRGAFKDCDLLTKINIPEGLKIIEERIFSDAARIQGKSIKFGSKLVLVIGNCETHFVSSAIMIKNKG